MVDSTNAMVIAKTDAPQIIPTDQINIFVAAYYENYLALMKLRQRGETRVSKITKGPFRCILEYLQPVFIRVTDHDYKRQTSLNFSWPKEISYHNPVGAINGCVNACFVFRLQSGARTDSRVNDDKFEDLDWSKITSVTICCRLTTSEVIGFEFYDSQNKSILMVGDHGNSWFKVDFIKGERVVGIQACKNCNTYYQLQFVTMCQF